MTDKNCEQRIQEELERTIEGIKNAFAVQEILDEFNVLDAEDAKEEVIRARREKLLEKDEAREKLDILNTNDGENVDDWVQGILSVDKLPVQYRVQLSWGGPSDEFIVTVEDNEIDEIEYVFMDWFDGAREKLHGDDFETVKSMLEMAYDFEGGE